MKGNQPAANSRTRIDISKEKHSACDVGLAIEPLYSWRWVGRPGVIFSGAASKNVTPAIYSTSS